MNERLASWFAPRRFSAAIFGMFTALAVILAAIEIYGVVSYFVTRTQGFGIRMALGATAGDVFTLVLRQAATLIAGAIVGVLVSFAVNRILASLLFGVRAADPFAVSVAVMTLALVALSATMSLLGGPLESIRWWHSATSRNRKRCAIDRAESADTDIEMTRRKTFPALLRLRDRDRKPIE
jgi:Predicted permease.